MRIHVVRFQHQSQRLDTPSGNDSEAPATLLFDPRLERGAERRIGDRYRRLDFGARSADLLVLRGSSPDFGTLVDEDTMLEEILEGKPAMVLAPEAAGHTPVLRSASWSGVVDQHPGVNELREAEILCGLHAEEAIYRQGGVHYLLPNAGYHAEAFVRLADSLNDQIDLIRLSDWLVEKVDERTALVADNGSMLALLTTVALRVNETRGFTPQIATLNEYPIAPTAIATMVDRLRVAGDTRLLFCVSVNSSGRVAREVANLVDVESEVVIICETGVPPDDGLERFARNPVTRWEIEADGRCKRCPDRHLLAVSPRSYELRTAIKLKPVGLEMRHAEANREFWEAAQETEAVKLHVEAQLAKGSATKTRHLAVQIDVTKMLAQGSAFRERCLKTLRGISPPQLVLIPEHECSEALAGLVREAFPDLGADAVLVHGIGAEAPSLTEHLDGVRHVLVVDDTIVSGATLVGLRRLVHIASRELGGVKATIFVPLSRPADPEDHLHVRRCVFPKEKGEDGLVLGGLHCAQELLLPDGNDDCPWCRERTMIEEGLDQLQGASHEFASQRRSHLEALAPPLLPCGGEEEGEIVGSFFGDLKPVTAFAAVSALAQYMHCEMERVRHDETIQVLDVALLLQAFFDPIIVAAMLRTLQPRDLRDAPSEPAVARTIRANMREYPDATIAELATAAIAGKLPVKPVRELLEERKGDWAQAYLDLLEGY